ncbi:MAG: transcription antitermination factor NusB [Oleispira antarctica]|uniref:Transcription antitermination protein NusB n=1 Tax=Oleispira antarctica RB-8 TaxID=698738 RepID=R4YRC1_OLEAN|nr:transcription antitermination factor NusB [Oleispira antarctica]MBQ0792975.1 transcription antitermination factor NusB [Oleispira antarctica]CCK77632.1 N utilization substance protein B homolog [Oleispira antarctica RB-8]|tara:strand:- start:719 stop:1306 length:588 start_codon:yes stop_codon:yes gene_type:complete
MSRPTGTQKASPAARRKARSFALQAIYQWHMAGADLAKIEAEFRADNDMSKVDLEYFHEILHGVPRELSALDNIISPLLDRNTEELTPVELSILRLATYEMLHRIDVPYKVVINEAVELAKSFGATDGHKYVNGVVDKVAQQVRTVEVKQPNANSKPKHATQKTTKPVFKVPSARIRAKGGKTSESKNTLSIKKS